MGFIGRGCFVGKIKASQCGQMLYRGSQIVVGLLFDECPEAGLGFGIGGEVLQDRHRIIGHEGVDDAGIRVFIATDFVVC